MKRSLCMLALVAISIMLIGGNIAIASTASSNSDITPLTTCTTCHNSNEPCCNTCYYSSGVWICKDQWERDCYEPATGDTWTENCYCSGYRMYTYQPCG